MTLIRAVSLSAVAATAVLLAGCTGLIEKIGKNVDHANEQLTPLVNDVGRAAPGGVVGKTSPNVVHEEGIWLGKNIVKVGQPTLPPIFYEPATFDRSVSSLTELAERITLRSGIPTKVSPDASMVSAAVLQGGSPSPAAASAASAVSAAVPSSLPSALRSPQGGQGQGAPSTPIRITYSNGNFKGLLDTASARFGVYWKYVDGTIHFFHTDSRTFQINTVPADASLTANVTSGSASTGGVSSGGSGGGGGGGGSGGGNSGGVNTNNSQNTGITARLSVYDSIQKSITAMLSSYGKVVTSPSTGTITVVDTPDTLDRVASFIEGENKSLARQVVINVTVLSVTLNDSDQYGINWNLVYGSLNRTYGITNTIAAADGSTSFSAGVIGSSKFSGSSLVIDALSKQGKVRRGTTASVVTLNNQPVPVQVATQTSYLASSQTTLAAQVGSQTTLTPGVVTAGFNMSILPHVLTNGTVLLQFSTDISTLREIRTVTSNGSTIEMPSLDTRNFMQRVSMKSNETLILSGFEQTDDNLSQQGVGHPKNFLLGGGTTASANKEVIVILITPTAVGS
jgi:type IVB pilus formation R64 PilN family outer membrane protein